MKKCHLGNVVRVEWFSIQGSRLNSPNHGVLSEFNIHSGDKAVPSNG